jgi:hypothetical protein
MWAKLALDTPQIPWSPAGLKWAAAVETFTSTWYKSTPSSTTNVNLEDTYFAILWRLRQEQLSHAEAGENMNLKVAPRFLPIDVDTRGPVLAALRTKTSTSIPSSFNPSRSFWTFIWLLISHWRDRILACEWGDFEASSFTKKPLHPVAGREW